MKNARSRVRRLKSTSSEGAREEATQRFSLFFIGMSEANRKKFIMPSDYDPLITKAFEKKKSGSSFDVPLLRSPKEAINTHARSATTRSTTR